MRVLTPTIMKDGDLTKLIINKGDSKGIQDENVNSFRAHRLMVIYAYWSRHKRVVGFTIGDVYQLGFVDKLFFKTGMMCQDTLNSD